MVFLYTVVRYQILDLCPVLIDIFSKVGNADHGLFTEVSSIALWKSMYEIKLANPSMTDDQWIVRAKRGQAYSLGKLAEFMTKFICEHTNDGTIIDKLEEFEVARADSRKLTGPLFKQLGEIPAYILKQPWLIAMMKAALAAPKHYTNGLFTPADLMIKKFKDNKELYDKLTRIIVAARTYMAAHLIGTKMTKRSANKLVDELDFLFV